MAAGAQNHVARYPSRTAQLMAVQRGLESARPPRTRGRRAILHAPATPRPRLGPQPRRANDQLTPNDARVTCPRCGPRFLARVALPARLLPPARSRRRRVVKSATVAVGRETSDPPSESERRGSQLAASRRPASGPALAVSLSCNANCKPQCPERSRRSCCASVSRWFPCSRWAMTPWASCSMVVIPAPDDGEIRKP